MRLMISALMIFCLNSCASYRPPQPEHTFKINIKTDYVEMPKEDFNLLFEAYVLYYEIDVDKDK